MTSHLADIRPQEGAEKWSRDHLENWKCAYKTHVEKFTDSKNDILFDTLKNNEDIAENRFQTEASPGAFVDAWPS